MAVLLDITRCARCQGDHGQLEFKEIDNPSDEFAYWAMCPVKQQPILMAVMVLGNGPAGVIG